MRKLLVILTTIVAFVACVREDLSTIHPSVSCEGEALISLSVSIPDMQHTRSFATPGISSLHLLVFNEDDYLVQVCEAEAVGGFGVAKDNEYQYEVKLDQSPYKRSIHLVANSPVVDIDDYRLGDHERYVINELYTEGGEEAYWAKVILEEGITGTYVYGENNSATFTPSESLSTALTNVPMVRNYSRITLDSTPSNFKNARIKLYNIPDRGSVAPLINDGEYASFATRNGTTNTEVGYNSLSAQGYNGYEPKGITLTESDWGTQIDFYERHQQTDGKAVATPAFAIIEGVYNRDSKPSYFKVDLCYTNQLTGGSELYNLLRNIEYKIIINSVTGSGYGTAEEAARNAASNNVSFAIEIKNLTNISDGERRLSVEYTQRLITNGGATVSLRYKYEPDITKSASSNGEVTFSNLAGNVLAVNNPNGATDYDKYVVSNVAGSDGWNTITFNTQTSSSTKTQTIILSAGGLQRSIEYILGEAYYMTIDMPDSVEAGVGKSVEATLTLQKGLPESIFPLVFNLVVEKFSLSPDASIADNNLPVVMGLNQYGEPVSGGNYFGYEIEINLEDYNKAGGNIKRLYFKTALQDSSSGVYVYNRYFNNAYDSFTVGD